MVSMLAMRAIVRASTILSLVLTSMAGCDGDGKPADDPKAAEAKAGDVEAGAEAKADGEPEAVADGPRFDKDTRKDPCALLKAEQVAKAAGVEVAALKNRTIAGMCMYDWGKDGTAVLGHITVAKTPEAARSQFENAYRSMTGEEIAAQMKVVGEKAKEKLEADAKEAGTKPAADPDAVEPVAGVMGKMLADGFQYEPVEGVGDAAVWDATKRDQVIAGHRIVSYGNELKVLVSNMYFTLQFRAGPGDQDYREPAIALAKQVVAEL